MYLTSLVTRWTPANWVPLRSVQDTAEKRADGCACVMGHNGRHGNNRSALHIWTPIERKYWARGCGSAVQVSPWLALMYARRGSSKHVPSRFCKASRTSSKESPLPGLGAVCSYLHEPSSSEGFPVCGDDPHRLSDREDSAGLSQRSPGRACKKLRHCIDGWTQGLRSHGL